MAISRMIPAVIPALVLVMVATPSTDAYNIAFNLYSNNTACSGSPLIQRVFSSAATTCASVSPIGSFGLDFSVQCQSNTAGSAWNATVYSANSCSSSGTTTATAQVLSTFAGSGKTCYEYTASGSAQVASASGNALLGLTYDIDCSGQVSSAATVGTTVMGMAAVAVSTVLALVVA